MHLKPGFCYIINDSFEIEIVPTLTANARPGRKQPTWKTEGGAQRSLARLTAQAPYEIRNENGKPEYRTDSFDHAARIVKVDLGDGIYQVIGPDTDCVLERDNGIVYPTAGTVDGQHLPPRTLAEAKEFFGQPKGGAE